VFVKFIDISDEQKKIFKRKFNKTVSGKIKDFFEKYGH
jgi:hypothetical protein